MSHIYIIQASSPLHISQWGCFLFDPSQVVRWLLPWQEYLAPPTGYLLPFSPLRNQTCSG